jgi:uncharacterized glyoxalase superfamily protein PhnB
MIFKYTILYVDDVAASLEFFQRAFAFERHFLHESGEYGELATGQTKLGFSATDLLRQLGKNPQPPSPERPSFEIAFETEDVAGALTRALEAGATLVQGVREQPWGSRRPM